MSKKIFCGRAFNPKRDFISADLVFTLQDLNVLMAWAMANNGKIGLTVFKSKTGKPYSAINDYNKNVPGEIPAVQDLQEDSFHRYGKEAMPESLPPESIEERPQEETINEDDIPF